jgi:hypothetical protein
MRVQSLRLSGGSFLLALLAMCCLAAPAAAQPKPYTVVISPATVPGNSHQSFTATITNKSSQQTLGSANLTVPTGFTNLSASVDVGTAAVSGSVVQLRNIAVAPGGGTRAVTVGANVPCRSNLAWTVAAKQSNDFNGTGNDFDLAAGSSLTTTVNGDCVATLKFVGQPANARTNEKITTSPYNTLGGPVTVEADGPTGSPLAGASVAVALAAGGGSGTLSGTTPRTTNGQGLASFDDLKINANGSYQLVASSQGVSSATSNAFRIDDAGTVCDENNPCTATVSSPGANPTAALQVVAASNPTRNDAGVLVINVQPKLTCAGYVGLADASFAVDFLPNTGSLGRTKVVTATISKDVMGADPQNGAAHLEMCFGAPFPFPVKPGTPPLQNTPEPFVGLLPDCGQPPCVSGRNKTQSGQGVITVNAPGDSNDPRYGP